MIDLEAMITITEHDLPDDHAAAAALIEWIRSLEPGNSVFVNVGHGTTEYVIPKRSDLSVLDATLDQLDTIPRC